MLYTVDTDTDADNNNDAARLTELAIGQISQQLNERNGLPDMLLHYNVVHSSIPDFL